MFFFTSHFPPMETSDSVSRTHVSHTLRLPNSHAHCFSRTHFARTLFLTNICLTHFFSHEFFSHELMSHTHAVSQTHVSHTFLLTNSCFTQLALTNSCCTHTPSPKHMSHTHLFSQTHVSHNLFSRTHEQEFMISTRCGVAELLPPLRSTTYERILYTWIDGCIEVQRFFKA